MQLAIIESFYGGSHRIWADSFKAQSNFSVKLYTLPARHWKWRMHGAAIYFANQVNSSNENPDAFVVTDILDVAVFKGLLKPELKNKPIILYMHENQLTYPWNTTDPDVRLNRNHHYAFINYTSMLASDQVWFNSNYHLKSWKKELPIFLNQFPDKTPNQLIEQLAKKYKVFPIAFDTKELNYKREKLDKPTILWNHRWEYDKNPEGFFEILEQLKSARIGFNLVVLGESTNKSPKVFSQAKEEFKNEIIHFGFCESRKEYLSWLRKCDVVLVTSNQDFFSISTIEAMLNGVTPLLPNRLAFPEHIAESEQEQFIYKDVSDCLNKLKAWFKNGFPEATNSLEMIREKYDHSKIYRTMDDEIASLVYQKNDM